jgi:3-dehydroquinate synthase
MVGAFYMPRLVYSCVSVLRSLSAPQFSGGFAEIMKHGLIRDGVFYEWLLDHIYEINGRDPDTLKEMLYRSNLIKKNVVEKDPFEKNERRLLNFGHTIGHAIEKYRNFELSHGECVALGCVAASYISWKKGYLSMDEYYEIRDMFVPYGLPISVENIDIPEVCRLVHSDKKVSAGTLHFVLLKKAGKAFIDTTVTDEEIEDALKEIQYTEDGE